MENNVMNTTKSVPVREIGVITQEIRQLCQQAQTTALMYIVEIGRRLVEAKDALAHGEWGKWLKQEVGFSQSTAENYMRLFAEYGASQITIFGASVDSQSFANLPYSKALALLSVEKEDREKFAEEVDAENISVKELKEAIRERDAEHARVGELERKIEELNAASVEAAAAADGVADLKNKVAALESALEAEKNKAAGLKDKLKMAKKNPEVSKDQLESIKKQAEEVAKRELEASSTKELFEARKKLEAAEKAQIEAEKAKAVAEKNLVDAQKRLKTADPEVNRFKTLFESLQEQAAKCKLQIEKIRKDDPETADKLSTAMSTFGEGLRA